nr:unnamed protein product [Spirometra erinaceieuropaei]
MSSSFFIAAVRHRRSLNLRKCNCCRSLSLLLISLGASVYFGKWRLRRQKPSVLIVEMTHWVCSIMIAFHQS